MYKVTVRQLCTAIQKYPIDPASNSNQVRQFLEYELKSQFSDVSLMVTAMQAGYSLIPDHRTIFYTFRKEKATCVNK